MLRVFDSGRASWSRNVLVVLFLVVLTGSSVFGAALAVAPAPLGGGSPSSTNHPAAASPAHAPASAPASRGGAAVHPASALPTLSFWSNNSTFAGPAPYPGPCQYFNYSFFNYNDSTADCYSGFTDPSALLLANGNLGVGYDASTTGTPVNCPSAPGNLTNVVEFQNSTDGGHTFGTALAVSGDGGCAAFNAIEPSFNVSTTGTIYGVWVASNFSGPQIAYTYRANDSLYFTDSTDNGATFSSGTAIGPAGNIARPQVVAFGQSVYVLYENISNSTLFSIPYSWYSCCSPSISLNLLYSPNGGLTWSGPYTLPGENSSSGYATLGGWLSVNATGMLGVSYFTNHSCAMSPYLFCEDYTDDLVFSTSTNNGTTWSMPFTIRAGMGESIGYTDGIDMNAWFQVVPSSAFVFSSDGQTAYVVWDGTYVKSATYYYENYYDSGIFAGSGSPLGGTWSTTSIWATLNTSNYDDLFNPSIARVGSNLYTTFTWANLTYCYGSACAPDENTFSESVASSADGVTWSTPSLVDFSPKSYLCSDPYCLADYFGLKTAIVGLNATDPVMAYSLGAPYTETFTSFSNGGGYNDYFNYSFADRFEVSYPYTGPTVSINVSETGLAPGTSWSFSVNGATLVTTSQFTIVPGIGIGFPISIAANQVPGGYNTIVAPDNGPYDNQYLTQNASFPFNYSTRFGLVPSIFPTGSTPYSEVEAYLGSNYYGYYEVYLNICTGCTPGVNFYPDLPWYFPNGTVVTLRSFGEGVYASFFNGTGPGSFTGVTPGGSWVNLTINGPINETAWWGSLGSYNVEVNALGLPSTSTYSFTLDGSSYSAAGGTSVEIPNLETGVHTIDSISATSSTSGWGYIGSSIPSSPFFLPVSPIINLTFAYVDLAAPAGAVSFEAQGLTAGTVWHFGFNGTTYSSDTPWINLTTRPGTFPVHEYGITSSNSSVGYAPASASSSLSVTTGSTYTIAFTPAYQVRATASVGGTVSGAGSGGLWLAAGATATFTSTALLNYVFGGWTGTGAGSYTGSSSSATVTADGPIVETASFYPLPGSRFNLTFTETGLAPGTWWAVTLNGRGYASNTAMLNVSSLLGCGAPGANYALGVPYAYDSSQLTRYVPTSHLPSTICTTGTTVLALTFGAQYEITLQSTAGGYATAQVGAGLFTSTFWAASGATITLGAVAQPGYLFLGWNGTGSGSFTGPGPNPSETVIAAGPITELASFAIPVTPPAPTYQLDFHLASAFAAGTPWSLVLNGTGYSSTGTDIVVTGLSAGGPLVLSVAAAISPSGLARYTPVGVAPTVTVTHNQTVVLSYSTSYWVAVYATAGGVVRPSSGWVTAGSSIVLNASANLGYNFGGWSGTGTGSYTGMTSETTIVVNAPITELATFVPQAPAVVVTGTSGSSFWSSPVTWAGLAVAGLLVGLVVGMLLARRGRGTPPMPPAEPMASSQEPSPGDDASSGGAP